MGYRDEYFKHNPGYRGWWTCQRCGKKLRKRHVEVDHIFPESKGGPDHHLNLQALCLPCNRRKSAKVDSDTTRDFMKKGLKEGLKWLFKR